MHKNLQILVNCFARIHICGNLHYLRIVYCSLVSNASRSIVSWQSIILGHKELNVFIIHYDVLSVACDAKKQWLMTGTIIHKASEKLEHLMVDIHMYVCISFYTTLLLKLYKSVCACTKHTAVTSLYQCTTKTSYSFNLFHYAHKNGMHFGMCQAGGELPTQIDRFCARPKEC